MSQQGLGSADKDRSLRLTSPSSTHAANGLLLVGILSEGWPPHTDGEKSVWRPAWWYNTTIRALFFLVKKKKKVEMIMYMTYLVLIWVII